MRRPNHIPRFLGLKGMAISSSSFQKPLRLRAEHACATSRLLFWDLVKNMRNVFS